MKINYRPEIDGLRAIAVFSVILYHAQFNFFGYFKGGFIGVDIFFVISGYLISSIILKELEQTGNFSFLNFYVRRARRILPALFVVMLVSFPFAWMILLPTSFIDYSKSILYSLGFSSNIYFHYSGLQYGAVDGLFKPFLHTWSLSVEEQFYVLFPIALIIAYKYYRKYLLTIFMAGFLISLQFADWGSRNYQSATFYFLHSRMWELLAGSILAYLEISKGGRFSMPILNQIFPVLGIFLVGHAVIFFDDKMHHPSFYTLSPVIGVCLLIWYANKEELITNILSSRLFVGTGLISYSLYLWHFPIFAFGRMKDNLPSNLDKVEWIILTIFLSAISYLSVERIFRNKSIINLKVLVISIIFVLVGLVSFPTYIIYADGIKSRFAKLYEYYGKNEIDNEILKTRSWKYLAPNPPEFIENEQSKVLFIGDSHSKDMFNVFYQNIGLFPKYQFSRLGFSIATDLFDYLVRNNLFSQAEIIIISDRFDNRDVNRLEDLIDFLKNRGKKVILLSKTNEYEIIKNPLLTQFDILFREIILDGGGIDTKNFSWKLNKIYYKKRIRTEYEKINLKLEEMANNQDIIYLRKNDFLCNELKKECDAVTDDGYKIFYDYGHFTLEGAEYFGRKIYKLGWFKLN